MPVGLHGPPVWRVLTFYDGSHGRDVGRSEILIEVAFLGGRSEKSLAAYFAFPRRVACDLRRRLPAVAPLAKAASVLFLGAITGKGDHVKAIDGGGWILDWGLCHLMYLNDVS